jgi:hypothetical protein
VVWVYVLGYGCSMYSLFLLFWYFCYAIYVLWFLKRVLYVFIVLLQAMQTPFRSYLQEMLAFVSFYIFSFKNWFFLYTFLFVPSIAADFRVSYTLFFFYMFLAYAYTQHELFTPAVDKLQLIHILILLLVAFRSYYYSHSNTPLLVIYEGFSWWIPVSFE